MALHMEVRIWNSPRMEGAPVILHGPPKRTIRRTIALLFDKRVEQVASYLMEANWDESI